MKCAKGYEIKPLKSAAGWYLGTVDVDGFPNCRLTSNYAPTEEDAKHLFMDRQMASENEFCNGGCGCLVRFQANPKFVDAMQSFKGGYNVQAIVDRLNSILSHYTDDTSIGDCYDLFDKKDILAMEKAIEILSGLTQGLK